MADPLTLSLLLAFLTGVLSFLSPCIIPMVIFYISTITGLSIERLTKRKNHSALKHQLVASTLIFILSFTIVFSLAGGAAGFAGSLFAKYTSLMSKAGGLLLLLFSFHLMGLFRSGFFESSLIADLRSRAEKLLQFKKFRRQDGGLSYIGVFLVGFFFALVCSHCIGPTLYPMLIASAASASPANGMLLMLAFSLGLGLPFLLTGLFLSRSLSMLERAKKRLRLISFITGLIIFIFGLVLLTDNYWFIADLFTKIIPWQIGLRM